MLKKADRVYFGGDYNPDQWDDATIDEDIRLFKEAGINMVTLPVFSWAKLEPKEGEYDFGWLDKLLDKLWENGIYVNLATPTTAQPAWLSTKYPEVLPVDIAGRKRTHGMRVFFCVNSEKYRERAAAIAEAMAIRYGKHPSLAVWHVANEYGTYCYCPTCEAKFRLWLKDRYGSIEELNSRWNTTFWGRIVYDFDEVRLPSELNDDYRFNPSIQLDYMRFVTHSTAECFDNEYKVLKKYTPDIPVSTNMSGYIKKLDQHEMLKHMDVAGWDNYPGPKDPAYFVAMKHDIVRGLKNGDSYMMTEQSPNQQNWQPYNKLKRPGEVRRLSYQAMAHGSDTCMFFQMRQSIGGQEKFHGAIISHAGHENTRVFRECSQIGNELKLMGDSFIQGRIKSEVAILFDWNNWWALELSSGPSKDMNYLDTVSKYYRPFYEKNIPVDIISVEQQLNDYKIVVAPMLYMIKEGVAERIEQFVKDGGTFIATTMSGLTDENDRCVFGEYPGKLRDILGIWVEEVDALFPEEQNHMEIVSDHKKVWKQKSYSCNFLCDVIHTRGAETVAEYQEDYYAGSACVTKNSYGDGITYYIGTQPEHAFLEELVEKICENSTVKPRLIATPGVEVTNRVSKKASVIFAVNHNPEEAWVDFGDETGVDFITNKPISGKVKIVGGDVIVAKMNQ